MWLVADIFCSACLLVLQVMCQSHALCSCMHKCQSETDNFYSACLLPPSTAVQSANTALLLPSIHLPLVSNPETTLEVPNKLEKEPLDIEASHMLFEKVAKEINTSHKERFSIDEIVYGWVWFSALIMSFLTYAAIRFIKAAGYMDKPHQNIMSWKK